MERIGYMRLEIDMTKNRTGIQKKYERNTNMHRNTSFSIINKAICLVSWFYFE